MYLTIGQVISGWRTETQNFCLVSRCSHRERKLGHLEGAFLGRVAYVDISAQVVDSSKKHSPPMKPLA
jgi:hypothetical protein